MLSKISPGVQCSGRSIHGLVSLDLDKVDSRHDDYGNEGDFDETPHVCLFSSKS